MAITVYIDGQCPMCVASALRFRRRDSANAVRFVNSHDPQWTERARTRFPAGELHDAMRVEMPDGTWRSGWFAWAAILTALPALRGVGRLMRLPVFYAVGPAFYKGVAARRQTISRLLRLPPPCDADGVCRLQDEHT